MSENDVLCFLAFGGAENSGLRTDDTWLFLIVAFRELLKETEFEFFLFSVPTT